MDDYDYKGNVNNPPPGYHYTQKPKKLHYINKAFSVPEFFAFFYLIFNWYFKLSQLIPVNPSK